MSVTLQDLSALQQHLATYKGRVLLVNHFATWCGGCVDEMPLLVGLRKEMGDVDFLLVSWDLFMHDATPPEVVERLQGFAVEQGIDFPIIAYTGPPDDLISAMGIETGTIPHTIVYDSTQHVVARVENTLESAEDVDRLRSALKLAR